MRQSMEDIHTYVKYMDFKVFILVGMSYVMVYLFNGYCLCLLWINLFYVFTTI